MFSAALVVFGLVVLQTNSAITAGGSEPGALVGSLMNALETLEVVGKETRIVRRCSKCLKKLIQISSSVGEFCVPSRWQGILMTVQHEVITLDQHCR